MRPTTFRRSGLAALGLALAAGCAPAGGVRPTAAGGDDPTPTSPSSRPLPSVDSAPAGGGGGISASDPIGTGQR
jgi:hypothetical protein